MVNPLASLDELIWNQCEKITTLANKTVGWDKYDLVEITGKCMAVSMAAWGSYAGIAGALTDSKLNMAAGLGTVLFGYHIYQSIQKDLPQERDAGLEGIARAGAPEQPYFSSQRPIILGVSLAFLGIGIECLVNKKMHFVVHTPGLSDEKNAILRGCMAVSMSSYCGFQTIAGYFYSQLPRPPHKKKSIWTAVRQYVSRKLGKQPEPAQVPLKCESVGG